MLCIWHMNTNSPKGFTLIETVVAVALIVGAVVGPLALVSQALFSAKSSKNKIVAAHLAQEGIEIVRHFRDSNILRDSTSSPVFWRGTLPDDGSIDQGCVKQAGGAPETGGIMLFELAAGYEVDVIDCRLTAYTGDPLSFDQSGGANNNLFLRPIHCSGTPCDPSMFRRKVTITDFLPGGFEDDPVSGEIIPNEQRLLVISQVFWGEKGVTRNISVQETLYNWR